MIYQPAMCNVSSNLVHSFSKQQTTTCPQMLLTDTKPDRLVLSKDCLSFSGVQDKEICKRCTYRRAKLYLYKTLNLFVWDKN